MDWAGFKIIVGVFSAAFIGFVGGALGGYDMLLKALIILIAVDYVSGLLAAFIEHKWDSRVGFKGVAKKVFILLLVAVAYQLDLILGTDVIRALVIGFYIGVEGLSITENATRAGLPIPTVLVKHFEQLKDNAENKKAGE